MNKRVLSVLFIICIGLVLLKKVCAEEPSSQPNQGLPLGERLVYQITWLRIPVAVGELWVKEKTNLAGREVYHVVGIIETNKVLSKIFPMHDEAHSWIDAETLESVQFEKKVNELFIKAHERMTFDAAKKKGYFESFKTGKKAEFEITAPVHDVISAIFWARRQALEPGKSVHTTLMVDQKKWALEVKVLRKEIVKFHGHKIETFRLQPNTRVNGTEIRGKAYFNLTTDASRIPIRGTYKAPFGRVTGTLQETESSAG